MHNGSKQCGIARNRIFRTRFDLHLNKLTIGLSDYSINSKIIDEGDIDVQTFLEHLANDPVLHTPAETCAMSER